MPRCVHCLDRAQSRSGGLCWTCSRDPRIRELYPSTSKFARRGSGLAGYKGPPLCATTARPGTHEKIAVMQSRAAGGHDLDHPHDAIGFERYNPADHWHEDVA